MHPNIGTVAGYTDYLGSVNHGYLCSMEHVLSGSGVELTRLRMTDLSSNYTEKDLNLGFTMAQAQTYRMHHYQHAGAANQTLCQALDSNDVGRTFSHDFDSSGVGAVGFATKRISASFDYILVYSLGGVSHLYTAGCMLLINMAEVDTGALIPIIRECAREGGGGW